MELHFTSHHTRLQQFASLAGHMSEESLLAYSEVALLFELLRFRVDFAVEFLEVEELVVQSLLD